MSVSEETNFESDAAEENHWSHHHRQEGHAVHLRLVDVEAGDVQDGRTEVDVRHQHLDRNINVSSVCLPTGPWSILIY